MQEKYRKHMMWWLDEFCAGDQVDHYVELFPELDSRLAKFAVGIFLWNMKGLIDINNPDDVSKVRLILKVLNQTPGYDFFDNVFNEADPDTVCQIIGMSPVAPIEDGEIEFDYWVSEIKNFEEAHSYFEMASWCIVISEESFKEYTSNGNRFYFCGNGDWWDVPCRPGNGFPRDRFGYSLIAVEVTPDNQIASITSRWNTCAGDTGDFITVDELKSILGTENYNNLFCKPTEITFFAQKFPKMNKLEYPEVSLYKLRLLSKGDVSLIVTRQDDNEHFYNISFDKIGNYYSLEEAEEALKTHKETDNDVISYQIIGPEHGHGDSTFVESEIDGIPDEIFETENYDESPEFQMIFDANRKFTSSYFYDANNPGGARLEHEISFNIGDKAWMLGLCYLVGEDLNILIPVIIEGKAQNKLGLNMELDGVRVKPLVTVRCNWGEYPDFEGYEIPRIDLLPQNIIK